MSDKKPKKNKAKIDVTELKETLNTEEAKTSVTKAPSRRIKQVYVSENGEEKREEITGTVRSRWDDDYADTQIFDPEIHGDKVRRHEELFSVHEDKYKKWRWPRIILVALVVIVSTIVSSMVGVVLALWDSEKTMADLAGVLFPETVMASTLEDDALAQEMVNSDAKATADNAQEKTEKAEKVEKAEKTAKTADATVKEESEENKANQEEEVPDEAQIIDEPMQDAEETDYVNEISGIDSFVKAGQEDELVSVGNNIVAPAAYVDPNANYPLSFTSVDESYFTDALFIGDSRMQGFGLWSGLPATFYCATGFQLYKYDTTKVVQTENGKVPIFEALPYDAFTKIYIKVGLNEMGWASEEAFEELYANVIAMLREREPRAIIYIHGLLPVTASKSASDKYHNNTKISARNEALAEFAVAQKAYFVDAGQALAGLDGCLPEEMTGDGIHLKSQYMPLWKDYLMQHAIVIR